jgi:GNAT superfamily N-acetyltransferase
VIVFAQEQTLSVDDYVTVVGSTYMAERRPVKNADRVRKMLAGSNMIVTARENGAIVGVLRGVSDGEWVCYVADLAVHAEHQKKGIGKRLLETCKDILGPGMVLILAAFPEAETFYRQLGMGDTVAFYFDREVSD